MIFPTAGRTLLGCINEIEINQLEQDALEKSGPQFEPCNLLMYDALIPDVKFSALHEVSPSHKCEGMLAGESLVLTFVVPFSWHC